MNTASSLNDSKAKLGQIFANIRGLDSVELRIRSKLQSKPEVLAKIADYLLQLGGKRIRPILALMSASLFNMETPSDKLVDVAAALEMIHMATLLHDDIIDHSPIRRHKKSAYFEYGLDATLLSGDFLLVRAFSLCAKLDQHIVDATELACVELTEGEISETNTAIGEHTLESSLEIARKKTAALFRLASDSGAHLAGANPDATNAMANFGESLGIAFQLVDDILDVTSTTDLLGKEAGTDIRERKPSLVNILWLNEGSILAKELLLGKPTAASPELIQKALVEIKSGSIINAAQQMVKKYAEKAAFNLNEAAKTQNVNQTVLSHLQILTDFAISRIL